MINNNLNQSNQSNQNNVNVKEVEVMERREEIRTEIEELINEIKEEEKELEFFGGELFYQDYDTNEINKSCEYIDDLINEYIDNKFIYYSEANKFLEDYDIFEEIKNYNNEFGTIPENECQLAAYILQNEIYNYDYNIIEEIYNLIDKIEELQEELDEIEEV